MPINFAILLSIMAVMIICFYSNAQSNYFEGEGEIIDTKPKMGIYLT